MFVCFSPAKKNMFYILVILACMCMYVCVMGEREAVVIMVVASVLLLLEEIWLHILVRNWEFIVHEIRTDMPVCKSFMVHLLPNPPLWPTTCARWPHLV